MSYGGQYQERGPRIPIRLIIAVVIAGIGLISYMMNTQVNPVTGEKQHIAMSVDQEMQLGLQAAPEMAEKMGGAIDRSDPRARIVSEVGRRLVEEGDASRSPYQGNFHFTLLDDPETVNAFALPGGQIFITLGLFNKLRDEAELAGVLGHEIGHVIHRHTAEQMAKGQLGSALTTAVVVGASDNRDNRGRQAAMAAMLANQMIQLHYGRHDESQSDTYGLRAMAQAGYDPSAMLDVMRVLKAASGGSRQPEFLSSHPLPESRLEEIQHELAEAYPNGVPGGLTRGRSLERLHLDQSPRYGG
jgi:predicted Zn-dependent protease